MIDLTRLGPSHSGNVAVFGALAILPIISVIGLSVDYERTVNARIKVQSIVDQAAIAAATVQRATANSSAAIAAAQDAVDDQVAAYGASLDCGPSLATVDADENKLAVSVDCAQDTAFMQIVGLDEIGFRVRSETTWLVDRLEVAFVFDMSASMAGNVADLQAAATDALDLLLPGSGSGLVADTRIAMVSYGDMVNAGELFEAATGMKPKRTYFAIDHYVESGVAKTRGVTYEIESTCVYERHGDFAFTDDAPDPTPPGHTPVITPVSMIDGVRIPRSQANGQYYNDPELFTPSRSLDNPHGFIGAQSAVFVDNLGIQDPHWYLSFDVFECGDLGPLPLTDDRAALDAYLASLTADGLTAGHQGIAWGWYLLSNKWASILPSGPSTSSQMRPAP